MAVLSKTAIVARSPSRSRSVPDLALCWTAAPPGLPTSAVRARYRTGNSAGPSAYSEHGADTFGALQSRRRRRDTLLIGSVLGAAAARWPRAVATSPPPLLILSQSDMFLTSKVGVGFTLAETARARSTSLRSRMPSAHHSHLFGGCSDPLSSAPYVPSNPRHADLLSDQVYRRDGLRPN